MEWTPRFLGVVWSVGDMGLLRPEWLLFVSLMGTAGAADSPEGPLSPLLPLCQRGLTVDE